MLHRVAGATVVAQPDVVPGVGEHEAERLLGHVHHPRGRRVDQAVLQEDGRLAGAARAGPVAALSAALRRRHDANHLEDVPVFGGDAVFLRAVAFAHDEFVRVPVNIPVFGHARVSQRVVVPIRQVRQAHLLPCAPSGRRQEKEGEPTQERERGPHAAAAPSLVHACLPLHPSQPAMVSVTFFVGRRATAPFSAFLRPRPNFCLSPRRLSG
mmetsp:Transcript_31158/g.67091  ORF Transcript_31158/g.67091 Transcript_31158/m.67091 type:complete len:211 (-) Transcript_31158:115-747(-)